MNLSIHEILGTVKNYTGVPVASILLQDRHKDVVRARHIACMLARLEGYTFEAIGLELHRHYSTVLVSVSCARFSYHECEICQAAIDNCITELNITKPIQPLTPEEWQYHADNRKYTCHGRDIVPSEESEQRKRAMRKESFEERLKIVRAL